MPDVRQQVGNTAIGNFAAKRLFVGAATGLEPAFGIRGFSSPFIHAA